MEGGGCLRREMGVPQEGGGCLRREAGVSGEKWVSQEGDGCLREISWDTGYW